MKQQSSTSSYSPSPHAGLSNPRRSGSSRQTGSNSHDAKHMHFLADLQCWLEEQMGLIYRMEPQVKTQRINGVYKVVTELSAAYQQGEDVDISRLPMSPMAVDPPALQGLAPGLSNMLQSFSFSLQMYGPESWQASTAGFYQDSGDFRNPNVNQMNTSIRLLTEEVMDLKLPIANESGRYPVRQFADEDSVVTILKHCVQMNISSPDQVAYILATAWHESRLGYWMTESGWLSPTSAENYAEERYGPNGDDPARARSLGNTSPGDGGRYMGRGYVQLTWKDNYARMSELLKTNGFRYTHNGVTYGNGRNGTKPIDLVANYRHVNQNQDLAARIMVLGMDGGHFAGSGGLDDFIPEGQQASRSNFESARRIVNGSDKKRQIADIAMVLASILRKDNVWSNLMKASTS